MNTNELICPVCNNDLYIDSKICTCGSHNFDVSKDGYVNLDIRGKSTSGDSQSMMVARRSFLEKRYYCILSNYISKFINDFLDKKQPISIVDIGCGEGYYLSEVTTNINNDILNNINIYGIDLSKTGIKMAAKKNKSISWIVANSSDLPIKNKSIDIAMSMFSIYTNNEISRILKDDGYFVVVRAGCNHLIELKEIIYPQILNKEKQKVVDDNCFTIVKEEVITSKVLINGNDDISNLLLMTPHYWKITKESKLKLSSYNKLKVTLDFICIISKVKKVVI